MQKKKECRFSRALSNFEAGKTKKEKKVATRSPKKNVFALLVWVILLLRLYSRCEQPVEAECSGQALERIYIILRP